MIPANVVLWGVSPSYAVAIRRVARAQGFQLGSAQSLDAPWREGATALAIADLQGTGLTALELMAQLRSLVPHAPVVALMQKPSVASVVEAMRLGAVDVIALPAPPKAVAHAALAHAVEPTRPEDGVDAALIGSTPVMQRLKEGVRQAAAHDVRVLLRGETGTGKGLVARLIHEHSKRAAAPFVHADCGAFAESVIESELFGHERGAFTGADRRRTGHFEAAGRGTIFLDEVGELSPALQVKLLRVLQERTFLRVGSTEPMPMTARVIAATHRDLEAEVRQGRFRKDLYYRLWVVELEVPPLRERLDDLAQLADHQLRELAATHDLVAPQMTREFCAALRGHAWPGNVRELRNMLERLLIQPHGGRLDAPWASSALESAPRLEEAVGSGLAIEDPREIVAALQRSGGNVKRASEALGVARSTLRDRIARYGLLDHVRDGRRQNGDALRAPPMGRR